MSTVTIDSDLALTIEKRCVCSDCWGQILEVPHSYNAREHTVQLRCSTEGCEFHGIISKKTVERREAESGADLANARWALSKAVPWIGLKSNKSTKQIMSELGF